MLDADSSLTKCTLLNQSIKSINQQNKKEKHEINASFTVACVKAIFHKIIYFSGIAAMEVKFHNTFSDRYKPTILRGCANEFQ